VLEKCLTDFWGDFLEYALDIDRFLKVFYVYHQKNQKDLFTSLRSESFESLDAEKSRYHLKIIFSFMMSD
jgi:hypothetical protein